MTLRYPVTHDEFPRLFTEHVLRTIRIVRVFEDADLGLRPGPGSLSTAEQIHQICTGHNFIRGVLTEETPTQQLFERGYDVSTVQAAAESLALGIREVTAAAAELTSEKWNEEIEVFGPEWRMSRGRMAYVMMDHETHHRGQLHVYARVAGKVPPLLYAPVDESLLNCER